MPASRTAKSEVRRVSRLKVGKTACLGGTRQLGTKENTTGNPWITDAFSV